MSQEPEIAIPGKNCWRKAMAGRAALLIDTAGYYETFIKCAKCARESILILGWDIDSRVSLKFKLFYPQNGYRLGIFLNKLIKRNKNLHIHILIWDYALFYALEREPLLTRQFDKSERIHFHYDNKFPIGGSLHQKVIVIDDKIAFSGGIDLTTHRWDTPDHLAHDPRRQSSWGILYEPAHDIQMMVEGEAASALGNLIRERWKTVTGEDIQKPRLNGGSIWPHNIEPDLENIEVAISRTDITDPQNPIEEVSQLFIDTIRAAKRYIYIENQFLTSAVFCQEAEKILKADRGPELVILTPQKGPGWIEDQTMGLLRDRVVHKLKAADIHNRLRIYYPVIPGRVGVQVFIHSKIFIADDKFLRVGSANLSNRSLHLDSECDLFIESEGAPQIEDRINDVQCRFLAEHLAARREIVKSVFKDEKSLISTIEKLNVNPRGLRSLTNELPEWAAEIVPESTFFDPEEPLLPNLATRKDFKQLITEKGQGLVNNKVFLISTLVILIMLGVIIPFSQNADARQIAAWFRQISSSPLLPLWIMGAYLLSGFILFPITAMNVGTAIFFGKLYGFLYAIAGCIFNAAVFFFIGRILGEHWVRKLAGGRVNEISKKLSVDGFWIVVLARNLPICPFTIANLAAGASHLSFLNFITGTFVGMAPGMLFINYFGVEVYESIKNDMDIWRALGYLFLLVFLFYIIKKIVKKKLAI